MGAISENPGLALNGFEQGLRIYDAMASRGSRNRQAMLQEQMQAMQLQDAMTNRQHQAALRPIELARAQRQEQDDLLTRRANLIGAMEEYGRGSTLPPELQSQFNEAFQSEFGPMIDNDGTGKTFAGFHPAPGGGQAMMVNVPQQDGSVAVKPVTQNRTGGPDDNVLVFDNKFFLQQGQEALDDLSKRLGVPVEKAKEIVDEHNKRARSALTAMAGGKAGDSWGDPYKLGDAFVQKNNRTGEIRQAVTDWREGAAKTRGKSGAGSSRSGIGNDQKDYIFYTTPAEQGGLGMNPDAAKKLVLDKRSGKLKLPAEMEKARLRFLLENGAYEGTDGSFDNDAYKRDVEGAAGGAALPKPAASKPSALTFRGKKYAVGSGHNYDDVFARLKKADAAGKGEAYLQALIKNGFLKAGK